MVMTLTLILAVIAGGQGEISGRKQGWDRRGAAKAAGHMYSTTQVRVSLAVICVAPGVRDEGAERIGRFAAAV